MRLAALLSGTLPVAVFCGSLIVLCADPKEGALPLLSAGTAAPAVVPERSVESLPPAPSAPLPASEPAAPPAAAAEPAPPPSQKPERKNYREVLAVVTAYCPCTRCCGPEADGRTSIGVNAWKRGIASDPRAVDYGTRVYVEGYGFAYIDDTGGALRRTWRRRGQVHLDLRMTYHWQAREWGRQEMRVRIYE